MHVLVWISILLYSFNFWGFSMDFNILLSKIRAHKGCFYWFFDGWFSSRSEGGAWLPQYPPGLWGGLWCFFLLFWFFGIWALYFFIVIRSKMVVWVLLDIASWTVFLYEGTLWRLTLRWRNLSSIAFKLCYQTMLYMLFNNSLVPCNPRLARSSWKLGKAIGCETEGSIRGTWIYIQLYEDHGPDLDVAILCSGFIMPCGWGWGDWLIGAWAATMAMASRGAGERVALNPSIT